MSLVETPAQTAQRLKNRALVHDAIDRLRKCAPVKNDRGGRGEYIDIEVALARLENYMNESV